MQLAYIEAEGVDRTKQLEDDPSVDGLETAGVQRDQTPDPTSSKPNWMNTVYSSFARNTTVG